MLFLFTNKAVTIFTRLSSGEKAGFIQFPKTYAVLGKNSMVFSLPDCSLACSFSMSKAITYNRISAMTPSAPLRRNRRKFRSSFSTPKAPSDWMLRFMRSRIPCPLLILSRDAERAASNAQLMQIFLLSLALVQHALCGQFAQFSAR